MAVINKTLALRNSFGASHTEVRYARKQRDAIESSVVSRMATPMLQKIRTSIGESK